MARTKGALNKRTRVALSDAAEGKLAKGGDKTIAYLLKITNDPARDDAIRLQAANVVLPYVKPKLSTIEQHNIDDRDKLSEEDIVAQLHSLVTSSPSVVDSLLKIIMQADPGAVNRATADVGGRQP